MAKSKHEEADQITEANPHVVEARTPELKQAEHDAEDERIEREAQRRLANADDKVRARSRELALKLYVAWGAALGFKDARTAQILPPWEQLTAAEQAAWENAAFVVLTG